MRICPLQDLFYCCSSLFAELTKEKSYQQSVKKWEKVVESGIFFYIFTH